MKLNCSHSQEQNLSTHGKGRGGNNPQGGHAQFMGGTHGFLRPKCYVYNLKKKKKKTNLRN